MIGGILLRPLDHLTPARVLKKGDIESRRMIQNVTRNFKIDIIMQPLSKEFLGQRTDRFENREAKSENKPRPKRFQCLGAPPCVSTNALINPRPTIATPAGTIPRTRLDATNPDVKKALVDQISFKAHPVLDRSCFVLVAENFKGGDVELVWSGKTTMIVAN